MYLLSFSQAVTPLFPFFAAIVVFMLLPTNPFFQCRCAAALIIEQSCINNVQQYNCADSFTFPFHHLFPGN